MHKYFLVRRKTMIAEAILSRKNPLRLKKHPMKHFGKCQTLNKMKIKNLHYLKMLLMLIYLILNNYLYKIYFLNPLFAINSSISTIERNAPLVKHPLRTAMDEF